MGFGDPRAPPLLAVWPWASGGPFGASVSSSVQGGEDKGAGFRCTGGISEKRPEELGEVPGVCRVPGQRQPLSPRPGDASPFPER